MKPDDRMKMWATIVAAARIDPVLRDAIQAAWLANPLFAVELAAEHGVINQICLRCAQRPLASMEPHRIVKAALGSAARQLCALCLHRELTEYLRPLRKAAKP